MGYAPRYPLGSITTTALVSAGANAIVPGSGPVVAVGFSVLNNLFGGAGRDAQRQARVDWFTQGAKQGSVWAARVILAAPSNVGSNEARQWQNAVSQVLSTARGNAAWSTANQLGGYWDSTDDSMSSKMRAKVENELIAAAQNTASNVGTAGGSRVVSPALMNQAGFDWTPVLLLGGVGLAAAAFRGGRRRSRW